jgi:hypothetical protein
MNILRSRFFARQGLVIKMFQNGKRLSVVLGEPKRNATAVHNREAKGPYTTFCGLAAEILENQVTLDTIVKNQKKILAKL